LPLPQLRLKETFYIDVNDGFAKLSKVKACGIAITVEAATESVVRLDGNDRITEVPPREKMFSAKAPQSFRYGMIWDLYQRAKHDGVRTIDSAHLCSIYGV
jgi:2-C-methyl-D-erythritol 4-phosphate cytidylyltransferase